MYPFCVPNARFGVAQRALGLEIGAARWSLIRRAPRTSAVMPRARLGKIQLWGHSYPLGMARIEDLHPNAGMLVAVGSQLTGHVFKSRKGLDRRILRLVDSLSPNFTMYFVVAVLVSTICSGMLIPRHTSEIDVSGLCFVPKSERLSRLAKRRQGVRWRVVGGFVRYKVVYWKGTSVDPNPGFMAGDLVF